MPTTEQAAAQIGQATLTAAADHRHGPGARQPVTKAVHPPAGPGAGRRAPHPEVGPQLEHDAHGRSPLVPTLKSFLDHGGHVSPAARELFIERRTLYHRMAVIGRLIGRDLSNPDTRLRLSVALRALDLLHTRHAADRPLHHD